MKMLRIRNDDGFSLIELAVVLLLIGVLVGIGIPVYFSLANSARDTAAQALVTDALDVEEAVHLTTGSYSKNRAELEAFEPSLLWNKAGNAPDTIRIRMRDAANGQEVCAYTLSESGTWFAVYHTPETTVFGRSDRLRGCTANIANNWAPW